MIRVTIWNEFRHERTEPVVKAHYPDGIHATLASMFDGDDRFAVRTATLDEPDAGLGGDVLDETDVLLWWGHKAHDEVPDDVARHVQERVLEGMGFIGLHSAHFSKPFKLLMGTHCSLKWRKVGERERVWNIAPAHPITRGLGEYFELEQSEMYGERFDIPEPDQTIFISWYQGGEVFRSGCTWNRGNGKVFYFSPGEEMFPIYHDANVRRVIVNATQWCAATVRIPFAVPNVEPLEPLPHHA
jgi:trehalose utilization protein